MNALAKRAPAGVPGLAELERAKEALARCVTAIAAKDLRDKARAIEHFTRAQRASSEARNYASEIVVRCEVRLGALLKEEKIRPGRPPSKEMLPDGKDSPIAKKATLKEAGISFKESARAQRLAEIPELELERRIEMGKATGKLTPNAILAPTLHPDYDGDEFMTPGPIAGVFRQVLGGIELDPASSRTANKVIKADRFITKDEDGLKTPWGDVRSLFMNPPYSQPAIDEFTQKLLAAVISKSVKSAVLLVNNATDAKWFQRLLESGRGVLCLPRQRIAFIDPLSNQALKQTRQGQVAFLFGVHPTHRTYLNESLGPIYSKAKDGFGRPV